MSQREIVMNNNAEWNDMLAKRKFSMKKMYSAQMEGNGIVYWRFLIKNNSARPRAIITTWIACHGKLSTKDRLWRFGMIKERNCNLCSNAEENIDHLFFACNIAKTIWRNILHWIEVEHDLKGWNVELKWIIKEVSKKGWKANLLKLATAEQFMVFGGIETH